MTEMLELALPDIDLTVKMDEDDPAPCEPPNHIKGLNGHDPSQPASYIVSFPCGKMPMVCAAWVEKTWSGQYTSVNCLCGKRHLLHECIVVKIRD